METEKNKQVMVESRVKLEWIVEFKKEMATEEKMEALASTYPFIVPHQVRVLKEPAYSPQNGLYLGLNSRDPGSLEENSMLKLKARWIRTYFNQRRKTVHTLDKNNASSSQSNDSEWHSLVKSLQSILQISFKRFSLIDDQHPEDEMKDVLVVDAIFIFMYLLHNRPPPQSEFHWLQTKPRFVPNGIPLWYDIFLLENQIPLQLLEHIARDVFQNFQVFVPVNITTRYHLDIVPGNSVDSFKTPGEILIRDVVSEALMSRFRSLFRVSSLFESRNCLQDVVLQVQSQDCDHLLDSLLRVICYKPSAEQRHKSMGQWALGRWKGVPNSDFNRIQYPRRSAGVSDSTIQWGFEDPEQRIRYDVKSLIGRRSDLENHLRSLRGANEEGIPEITVERLIQSLRVTMRPRVPDPSLDLVDFRARPHRAFSRDAFQYLLTPELILQYMAVEYGIPLNIVKEAIENHYIYVDPDERDIRTMQEELRDLLTILPHVRVTVKTLGGTKWSRALIVSSLLGLAHTPRWVRVPLVRFVLAMEVPIGIVSLRCEPIFVHLFVTSSRWLRRYTKLLARCSNRVAGTDWSNYYQDAGVLERGISGVRSVVTYVIYLVLALLLLWFSPAMFLATSMRLFFPLQIVSNKYHDLKFKSKTQFRNLVVSALRQVGSDQYGLILIYFAERMLLQEAVCHALQPEMHVREPALARVLQEAIEARADFIEFPGYSRGGWLPPHREIDPPMNSRWRKRLLKDHARMKEDNWMIPSATKLKEAGIGIGTCDLIHQTHLDLSRRKPILRVPKLLVNDEADSLLRNLAALERIKSPLCETPLASFIKLMDNLIDTTEDVSVLREAGVIVHHLGSDVDVANYWNEMGSGLRQCPSERWDTMLTDLNILSRDKKRQMWIEFKTKYTSRPWLVTGTVAAVLLVVLAIVQTIFTGFQVFLKLPLQV